MFYIISILVGGFSAFLGYVLSLLAGCRGIAGWAWIFVSECDVVPPSVDPPFSSAI